MRLPESSTNDGIVQLSNHLATSDLRDDQFVQGYDECELTSYTLLNDDVDVPVIWQRRRELHKIQTDIWALTSIDEEYGFLKGDPAIFVRRNRSVLIWR